MPTFTRPPLNGISLSDALREAAGSAATDIIVYRTYEFRNYYMATPLRVVDSVRDLYAKLENTAPANPAQYVTFYACNLIVEVLEESSDAGAPEIGITLSNVNGEVSKIISLGRNKFEPWYVTERIYVSNDLTGPARQPVLTLIVTNAVMNGRNAALRASFGESSVTAVPKLTFKQTEYPGLVAK